MRRWIDGTTGPLVLPCLVCRVVTKRYLLDHDTTPIPSARMGQHTSSELHKLKLFYSRQTGYGVRKEIALRSASYNLPEASRVRSQCDKRAIIF
jgi:hypothetical protein